ncbi:hypothetical protein [Streptomyces sp. SAJ15]|uniref:hypothetical protein n=1 Tax=Streptomyces sp. SAJ15 TaxID=2011095 RepID=UPI001186442D|nr:hypothetical protein [Streptomyces sp. SAJ15]TVL92305.1 hypothetical protein CD790_11390 [Streptomyces sp. SAJ15]
MRLRTASALGGSATIVLAALAAWAPAAVADAAPDGPTPYAYVSDGGQIKVCTRGTLFDGMVNLGCRPPHHLGPETTWRDLREEEDAVAPMLCRPAVVNEAVHATEVTLLGAGAALQCTPVPASWGP